MDVDDIVIEGARENNLKNLNVRIPKRKITVFTGVSGPANLPWSSTPSAQKLSGSLQSLCHGRADNRTAYVRYLPSDGHHEPLGRRGQHGGGHRTQPGCDQERGLDY